jgi:hypothetical protein
MSVGRSRSRSAGQVEGLTIRYGRYTPLLLEMLRAVGLALAGGAGARLLAVLNVVVSRVTLLSIVLALSEPVVECPRILGVDEFALKRSRRYGTVLVDVETHRVIDILADYTGDTFAARLTVHPEAEVIWRDRADSFSAGARRGAPQAQQCADRFQCATDAGEAGWAAAEVGRAPSGGDSPADGLTGPAPDGPGRSTPHQPDQRRRAMKVPIRHLAGHLLWSAQGGVWAIYRLRPGPDEQGAHTETVQGTYVPRQVREELVYRALGARSLEGAPRLYGLCAQVDAGEVAVQMLDGVDPTAGSAAHQAGQYPWPQTAEAALDLLEGQEMHRRTLWLAVPLNTEKGALTWAGGVGAVWADSAKPTPRPRFPTAHS